MEIYLVRHGETGGNVAHRHQAENTQLSFVGEQQVKRVAELLEQYKPTHLVTSNLVRAIESARAIGKRCNLIPETNAYFIELARPDCLYGHHHRSLKSMWFYLQWYLGISNDGESYKELRERLVLAQEYLAHYPDSARLVVVSHSVFINFFIAHLCYKKSLGLVKATLVFWKIITTPNAHVIKLNFNNKEAIKKCAWSVSKLT
jgi:broad specificity phosphatase PhoE